MLDQEGYEKKSFQEEADVYVINTCSVTENADKECKQLIRRVKKQNPEATVVITGCYAQLKPELIAQIEGVDLVIGAGEKYNIVEHLRTYKKNGQAKICSCDIDDVEGFHTSWSQKSKSMADPQRSLNNSIVIITKSGNPFVSKWSAVRLM